MAFNFVCQYGPKTQQPAVGRVVKAAKNKLKINIRKNSVSQNSKYENRRENFKRPMKTKAKRPCLLHVDITFQ